MGCPVLEGSTTIVLAILVIFLVRHYLVRAKVGYRYITADSRNAYIETSKTIITASGIAIALVVVALDKTATEIVWIPRIAVVLLLLAIVFALTFIVAAVRLYEVAEEDEDGDRKLSDSQLYLLIGLGSCGLLFFLEGFLFLVALVFYMS